MKLPPEELKRIKDKARELYGQKDITLAERIAYVKGATAEYERSKWIPVSERLPELGDEYNVVWEFEEGNPVTTTMEFDAKNKRWLDNSVFNGCDSTDEVTHWQPLPPPETNND